jgi:hypothetical protein
MHPKVSKVQTKVSHKVKLQYANLAQLAQVLVAAAINLNFNCF